MRDLADPPGAFSPLFNIWPDIELVGEACPGLGMEIPVRIGDLENNERGQPVSGENGLDAGKDLPPLV